MSTNDDDKYFQDREYFFSTIEQFGVDPDSEFASRVYDKYQLGMDKKTKGVDEYLKGLLEAEGKLYTNAIKEYNHSKKDVYNEEDYESIPVDKYLNTNRAFREYWEDKDE